MKKHHLTKVVKQYHLTVAFKGDFLEAGDDATSLPYQKIMVWKVTKAQAHLGVTVVRYLWTTSTWTASTTSCSWVMAATLVILNEAATCARV